MILMSKYKTKRHQKYSAGKEKHVVNNRSDVEYLVSVMVGPEH